MLYDLHKYREDHKALTDALAHIPEDERLAAVREKNYKGNTVLDMIIGHPDTLNKVLELLPEDDRLAAVKEEDHNGYTVLHKVASNPDALNQVLKLYPQKERLTAVKMKYISGNTVLHMIAHNPDALNKVLKLIPEDERYRAVIEKDSYYRYAVLHIVAYEKPDELSKVLLFIPEKDRYWVLSQKDKHGDTVLHMVARNTCVLNSVLVLLPKYGLLSAIKEKDAYGNTFLHRVAGNPGELKTVLAHLPGYGLLAAVKEKNRVGETVLHKLARHSDALKAVLALIPEDERLAAVKEKNNGGDTVLYTAAGHPDTLKALLSSFNSMQGSDGKLIVSDELVREFSKKENLLGLSNFETEVPVGLLALNIIYVLKNKAKEILVDNQDAEVNDTYAGSENRVKKSEERYKAVQAHYGDVFAGRYNQDVDKVETDLKKDILKSLKSSATGDKAKEIEELLTDENINKLAEGSGGDELAAKARKLFKSNDDVYQIAWRAYDKDAERIGWDNLFVAPATEKDVHSGGAVRMPLSAASSAVRERVAIYYIAACDESTDETKEGKEERINALISNIAECRRAHNIADAGDATNIKADNPSCYPGTLTRISNSLISHPLFKESEDIEEQIRLRVKTLLENKLEKILSGEKSSAEKEKIYLSVLMLGLDNINDVLIEPFNQSILTPGGDELIKTELTTYRAEFLRALNIGDIIHDVSNYMGEKNITIIPEKLELFVIKSMLDMGGLKIGLNSKQQEALGYMDSEQSNPEPGANAAASSGMSSFVSQVYQPLRSAVENRDDGLAAKIEGYKKTVSECLNNILADDFKGDAIEHFVNNNIIGRPKDIDELNNKVSQKGNVILEELQQLSDCAPEGITEKIIDEALQAAREELKIDGALVGPANRTMVPG